MVFKSKIVVAIDMYPFQTIRSRFYHNHNAFVALRVLRRMLF